MAQKAIGASFYDELVAYQEASGVSIIGKHFTWSSDGDLFFFGDTPTAVVAAIESVYAAHNPDRVPMATLAQAALFAGIEISSLTVPAINGTYACDPLSQADIVAIETGLNAGKGFPGGATTFGYPDIDGVLHTFSETVFANFA